MGVLVTAGVEVLNLLGFLFANLGLAVDFIIGNATDGMVKKIRNFIAPVMLLIVSLISLTFLFKRQFQQFGIFLGITALVAIIFYSPEIIVNFGKSFGEQEKDNIKWGD